MSGTHEQKGLDSLPDGLYIAASKLSGEGERYSGFAKGLFLGSMVVVSCSESKLVM
jgi:hypothetical protein